MKRLPALAALLAASALLAACAAPKPRFEGMRKCYIPDSTAHISGAQYAAMFAAARPDDEPLLSCDSTSGARVRVRPLKSRVPDGGASAWMLGADLAVAGAGTGLALALGNGLWMLAPAPLLPLSPMARASYLIEYKDSNDVKRREVIRVRTAAWFRSREESRHELLDASVRRLAGRLYGTEYENPHRRVGRISIEPIPLIFQGRNDAVIVSPHFEKFLPANISMEFSPTASIPLSGNDAWGSLYVGPRLYFFDGHWGPFLGVSPYGTVGYDRDLYGAAGLPGLTGFVWQGWRMSLAFEVGAGPVYRWGGPETDLGWVVVGGLNVGVAF